MKLFTPSYYDDFCCIADRCRHTCCAGWEIDIDADTAAFYRTVEGLLGARLNAAMHTDEDGVTSFALTADERCPMLNESGLCDVISALGKEALCDICHAHPRFRFDYRDRTEWGLGLCCEAAAALILRQSDPVMLCCRDDGAPEGPADDELALLRFREAAFAIVQDRTRSIDERTAALAARFHIAVPMPSAEEIVALYAPLERMDPAWDRALVALQTAPNAAIDPALAVAEEQLLWYLLYRHLPSALDDDRLRERVAFVLLSARVIRLLCAAHGGTRDAFEEAARAYSAEIEYSDSNIDRLLSSLSV